MAYKMVSPSLYPFRRENAKFFSQELIENVLFDFGHVWKPVRSKREIQLRKVASFVFTPPIGRLVAYISRKYAGFVVMKCFRTWNYINSHRPSIRERMLCNEIVTVCTRSELENDDLSLFTFMAIVTEYARLAITHEQENLIGSVVDALSYSLTDKIPGGFVPTLDRMENRALNFNYPRNYIVCDYDPTTRFVTPVSTDSVYTPRSEFESPIMLEHDFPPDAVCSTPTEDIVTELKNRKLHRELFRRKMMIDRATQTDIESEPNVGQLQSMVLKSEIADFIEKLEIPDDNLDNPVPEGIFIIVETNDVSVQTWSCNAQLDKYYAEIDKFVEKDEHNSEGELSVCKHTLDLKAVVEKLKVIERLQIKDELPGSACSNVTHFYDIKFEDKKSESRDENLNTLSSQSVGCRELVPDTEKQSFASDTCRNRESELQSLEINRLSEKDISINESLCDSQFGSLDISTDDPTKIGDERYPRRKNYSFDSQIGSLDESIRTSDESRLEN